MRKLILWMTEHPTLTVSLLFLTAFALLNLLAYRHARTMTHFASAARGPRKAEIWHDRSEPLSLLERLRLAFNGVAIERPHEDIRPEGLGLPCEVHTFPGGAGQLAAWHIPHDRAAGLVVIFHGYAANKAQLLPEARAFHDLGYACFLVDFRGSGDSDGDRTSIGYHEADDVESTVAYVRDHWPGERLILFGQSMGAASVLRALSRRALRPDAVVLECPFDRLLSTVEARFAVMGLPPFPGARLMVFWGGLQHGFNGFAHNPVEYARRVMCPALLLHGTHDTRVSCQQIESIYQNLGGEKQLHYFEGAGHESYAASRPEEWKECVARFLHRRALVG
jgi:uncharacterized protein